MDQNGTKVSFTLTNVANAAGVDEPDLARVHAPISIVALTRPAGMLLTAEKATTNSLRSCPMKKPRVN